MLALFISFSLYALHALAQNQGLPVSGPEKPGIGNTPEALKISEEAGRNPNATNEVSFRQKHNDHDETWTWRVNVTEIAVPNRIADLGDPSADFSDGLHVANTQWQLDWNGDSDSLESLFKDQEIEEIFFAALVSNKPSNITDLYNDDDGGNCKPILGDECVESLVKAASKDSAQFSNLGGCEDSLNVNYDGGVGFTISRSKEDSDDEKSLQRDDALFYSTSKTYSGGNTTLFNQSLSALQVFAMHVKYGGDERGGSSGPTVLCKIVDQSAQEDSEDTEDEGTDDDAAEVNDNGAMIQSQSRSGFWFLFFISVLVVI